MRIKTFPTVPRDPLSFWSALHRSPRYGFFLGSGAASPTDHVVYMSASEPTRVLKSLNRVEQSIQHSRSNLRVPRWVGVLGFDAGRDFDSGIRRLQKKADPLKVPRTWFGDYRNVVKIDFLKKQTIVYADHSKIIERVKTVLNQVDQRRLKSSSRIPRTTFTHSSLNEFSRMVKKAKEAIANGDIYQANLSLRFRGRLSKSPLDLYRILCKTNPSPYAALIKQGSQWIVSCSPELLFSVNKNIITTRPIAGTRPRGKTSSSDRLRQGQLLLSPKERAEHIMLVDLERNDVGKVARPGSVRVTDPFSIERYSHVMHIVSQVQGRLQKNKNAIDVLKAVFPGGTITGCPKIKSIEVIESLENVSRGPFYGSAGFFCWNGDATFNLLIRSALIQGKTITIQAGAGIVADSHPKREYNEIKAKAQALLEAVNR